LPSVMFISSVTITTYGREALATSKWRVKSYFP
jgi:hypothetical protein